MKERKREGKKDEQPPSSSIKIKVLTKEEKLHKYTNTYTFIGNSKSIGYYRTLGKRNILASEEKGKLAAFLTSKHEHS